MPAALCCVLDNIAGAIKDDASFVKPTVIIDSQPRSNFQYDDPDFGPAAANHAKQLPQIAY